MNKDKNKKEKDPNAFFSYKIPQTKKVLILETNFAISVFFGGNPFMQLVAKSVQ